MDFTFRQEERIRAIVREEIQSATNLLPTKDEFFTAMSELMGEVKAMREEFTMVEGHKDQLEDHETRIASLESLISTNA